MRWIWQTPFLAVLVFGIGVSLGLAWKTGWIPVELSTANTGELSDGDALEDAGATRSAGDRPVQELTERMERDSNPASPQHEPPLPENVEAASMTESFDRPGHPVRPSRVGISSVRPVRVAHAPRAAAEPEWAAQPSDSPAKTAPAFAVPDNTRANSDRGSSDRGNTVRAGVVQAGADRDEAAFSRTIEAPRGASRPIRQVADQEPFSKQPRGPADEPLPSASPLRTASQQPEASTLAGELKAIDEQIANDEILSAHRSLSKLYWSHKEARGELLPRLEQTARMVFFESRPHFVDPYVVRANDQLRVIAANHQLSWEYLAKLNRTDPKRIQVGQKLKILKGPFAAVVDLGDYALTVHLQGYFVKRYPVGIGKDGASPVGKFTVLNKIENPQYTGPDGKVVSADDPANPLGERWIDLGESYGIHGTIEPDSIGRAASRGCIRMRERDVIEVYDFLVKGSEVVIRK